MTDRELMQMALDALNNFDKGNHGMRWQVPVIKALRAALAQPEPEPFEYWNAVEGWVKIDEVRQHFDTAGCGTINKTAGEGRVPLYTAPQREFIGLTDEEIGAMEKEYLFGGKEFDDEIGYWAVYRAIEAKLKEKNT